MFPNYGALTTSALGEGTKKASWHCQLLATSPEHQRKGLARALVEEVEKSAGPKCETLTVETETDIDVRDAFAFLFSSHVCAFPGHHLQEARFPGPGTGSNGPP
jgi:GNAT superfamily N-acetyltransferase